MTIRNFLLFALPLVLVTPVSFANLIVNGDAETGDLTGWTDSLGNGFNVLDGSTAPFPFEGSYSFWGGITGGSGSLVNEIRQDVDLSGFATDIDNGDAVAVSSAAYRSATDGTTTDTAEIILEFRDSTGVVLGVESSGVAPVNQWVQDSNALSIPVGTHTVRVRLRASRSIAFSTDGYFDALSLTVSSSFLPGCDRIRPDAVGWWPGDGHAIDLVSGNDGATVNGAGFAFGQVAQAFGFDGTDDFIDGIGAASSFSFVQNTGVFTMEAWIRLNDPAAQVVGAISMNTPATAEKGYFFVWENRSGVGTQQLRLLLLRGVGGSPTINSLSPANVITDSNWHHVAAVGDGSGVVFYVDGVAHPGSGSLGSMSSGDSTDSLFVGGHPGGFFFNGRIDELRIYDRALSSCEILSVVVAGDQGSCRGNADGDAFPDPLDNCPETASGDSTDTDGDGFGDVCDCAPMDAAVSAAPTDHDDLFLRGSQLDWCLEELRTGSGTTYDVLRGAINELPVGGGASETCLDSGLMATSTSDTDAIDPAGFYYLVRGENSCGMSSYGSDSTPTERMGLACP